MAPLTNVEHEHSEVGVTPAPSQSPHAFRHFFAVFLHFFFFDGHAAVAHRPLPTFLAHLRAFHLSLQAASVRFTHTAATRATSSARRISPEAQRESPPQNQWRTPPKEARRRKKIRLLLFSLMAVRWLSGGRRAAQKV